MTGWKQDPSNPGWYLWEGSDAAGERNWTQSVASEPPEGFYPDPKNVGWYFTGEDPADPASWWSDETVPAPVVGATPDPWKHWSAETIARIAQVPVAAVRTQWPLVHAALVAAGQGSKNSLAAAIATISIETASTFAPVREAFWLSEEWRKANLRYWPWYGRSLIQLTWENAYLQCQQETGMPIHDDPENAMKPEYAAGIFAWYWKSRDIQAPADRGDWRETRRLVQGADAGLSRLVQIVTGLLGV